jgi:uncharacterized membrane protein
MNTKLILQLSLFGLVMAVGTVYFIPSGIEPFLWLAIFLVCAYIIAKQCTSKYFLHGFMVSLANCVWVTSAHVLLYHSYIANHAKEAAMMATGPMANHPRLMMLIMGPIVGVISGLVLGLFSWIASKIIKKPVTT